MILIRRIHLYAGLFLLPWVLLYGITGAMFNHQELFPAVRFEAVDASLVRDAGMAEFPSPGELAQQVADAIEQTANVEVVLNKGQSPEFTSPILFETYDGDGQHVVQIDPIQQTARLLHRPPNAEQEESLLQNVQNIQLSPNPHQAAHDSARAIFAKHGLSSADQAKPLGWTKLNFLASVDGQPARITYVLKDGHIDVTKYTGEDGMIPRQFLLRLHTAHGQPPHWNMRMFWSLFVDAMALAMVTWGITGLVMWWQIKRTRLIGTVLIAVSLLVAAVMYFGMMDFYATTKL
ncbi:MAG: PepSY domain-containing protein [Planctomycetaceae bacterium]|nr:PepSY domain-containing protein [Planctomycetaceae bacterium]